jgi:phosphate transport system protein
MVRDALDSFMESDPEKARIILERDDAIDRLNDKIYEEIQTILAGKPQHVTTGISLIMVSHNLERVADLATNIAEDVIYLKRGLMLGIISANAATTLPELPRPRQNRPLGVS